jgi:O-antigen/teichoic acid export membrane protein
VTLIICLPTIFSRLKLKFDKAIIIACLAFGLPNLPNSLFVQVIELADRKILALLRSTTEVGVYSAGYKLGMFLSIVAMGFRYAWQPFFLQISDRSDAQEVYARVFTYYMALTFWLYLLLTAFVEPIATWDFPVVGYLIAPGYWSGLKIFPVVLLAQVFNGAFAVFMVGMYLKKKMYVLPFITGVAALINVAINIAFVPQHGMWASAWATVAAYAAMTILLYFYINRRYPIQWEWNRIFHLLLTGALIYAASAVGKQYGMNWISYISCLLYPFILVITGLASTSELAHLKNWKKD